MDNRPLDDDELDDQDLDEAATDDDFEEDLDEDLEDDLEEDYEDEDIEADEELAEDDDLEEEEDLDEGEDLEDDEVLDEDEDDYYEDEEEEDDQEVDARQHLRELVTFLAASLTDQPDAVDVRVEQRGPAIHLSLRVPEEELGKVIGRQGRIARAMRTAVMIAGSRHNVRASLDIEG